MKKLSSQMMHFKIEISKYQKPSVPCNVTYKKMTNVDASVNLLLRADSLVLCTLHSGTFWELKACQKI